MASPTEGEAGLPSAEGKVRLTIAIPTLNRAALLRRAIDSALAQTAPAIEILVSNNGSNDDTRAVVDSYADPRLRTYHHATTIPAVQHGNFLIAEARGELFLGLSDDDHLEPEFAERVIELYDRHPSVSFVYTRCWTHVRQAVLASPAGPELEDPLAFIHGYFTGRRQLFWCACVTRTDDLRRIGGVPSGVMIGDMQLWTKIVFSGPVGCVDALLSHYTYLTGNSSMAIPVCAWAGEMRALFQGVSERLDEMEVPAEARASIRRAMQAYLARSTANQFALNASRGVSKRVLVRALRSCGGDLRGDLRTAVPRVLAALVLPSEVASMVVNAFVTRRSRRLRKA